MAFEEITNEVREVNGETRIFCANCGDPEGHTQEFTVYDEDGDVVETTYFDVPPTGYALPHQAMQYWKKANEDTLVCADPRCLAAVLDLDDEELTQMLADGAQDSNLTEEQVAAMPSPVPDNIAFDLDEIPTHGEGE